MAWHPNNALAKFIKQWKEKHPGAVVGTIADKAHGSTSDHQEDSDGTVDAADFMTVGTIVTDKDLDSLAEILRKNKDNRIKFVIRRQRIFYGHEKGINAWKWQVYTGDYHHHCHVSTLQEFEDDGRSWNLSLTQPYYSINVSLNGYWLPSLKQGDSDDNMAGGDYVRRAQVLLNRVGNAGLTVDGDYGPKMAAAVAKLNTHTNGKTILIGEWVHLLGLVK